MEGEKKKKEIKKGKKKGKKKEIQKEREKERKKEREKGKKKEKRKKERKQGEKKRKEKRMLINQRNTSIEPHKCNISVYQITSLYDLSLDGARDSINEGTVESRYNGSKIRL